MNEQMEMTERDKIAKLVEFLMGFIWEMHFKLSQEIHAAIWWLKGLAFEQDDHPMDYHRRTIRRQIHILRQAAYDDHFAAIVTGLDDLIAEFGDFLNPEPPKPMRINELRLLDSLFGWNEGRVHVDIFFIRGFDEKLTWIGLDQGGGRCTARCSAVVVCNPKDISDGLGGGVRVLEPFGVYLKSGAPNTRDLYWDLVRDWKNPNLFGPHDFVRVMDLKSPAYGMMTTIQRKSLIRKDKK